MKNSLSISLLLVLLRASEAADVVTSKGPQLSAECAAAQAKIFAGTAFPNLKIAAQRMQGLEKMGWTSEAGSLFPGKKMSSSLGTFYAPYCKKPTALYPCDPVTGATAQVEGAKGTACEAAFKTWDQSDKTKTVKCPQAQGTSLNTAGLESAKQFLFPQAAGGEAAACPTTGAAPATGACSDLGGRCCDAELTAGKCIVKTLTSKDGVRATSCSKRWWYNSVKAYSDVCSLTKVQDPTDPSKTSFLGVPFWISAKATVARKNSEGKVLTYEENFVDSNFMCIASQCTGNDAMIMAQQRADDCASKYVTTCQFTLRRMEVEATAPVLPFLKEGGFGYKTCDSSVIKDCPSQGLQQRSAMGSSPASAVRPATTIILMMLAMCTYFMG